MAENGPSNSSYHEQLLQGLRFTTGAYIKKLTFLSTSVEGNGDYRISFPISLLLPFACPNSLVWEILSRDEPVVKAPDLPQEALEVLRNLLLYGKYVYESS